MAEFVPGAVLNAGFYRDVVAPLLEAWPHQAALLGWGSDVLGYDTACSRDHGWGPRLQVFVEAHGVDSARRAIDTGLPAEYAGEPVAYGWDDTPVQHHVEVTTLASWLHAELGHDAADDMTLVDWLVTPQQRLLGIVRGAVYHDDGTLAARCVPAWPGIPTSCGVGWSPASGGASRRKRRSSGAPPRSATSLVPASSWPGWCARSCGCGSC